MASLSTIQAPKGTQDILPPDSPRWQAVERIAREVAALYHFDELRTPIFEHSELFHRGVGETTDIVSKETYTFNDRDNRLLTLRPEGTAGVVRAVIEAGMLNDPGSRVKVFYIGPNFRYERPQKGRYRQHHQFGVEAFGVAEAVQGAPPAAEYLAEACAKHFARAKTLLEKATVPFSVDGNLVRGFDYYTGIVWEVTAGGLGAQNAIGGGGRYDNLVETLGGKT